MELETPGARRERARRRGGSGPRPWTASLLGVLMLMFCTDPIRAAEAPEKLDPAASCLDGGCHSEIGKSPHLHWKDFGTDCRKCHEGEPALHEFELEDEPELCMSCHEDEGLDKGKVVHEPMEDGCGDCHDPHGSTVENLLTSKTERGLCLDCHETELFSQEFKHGPVDSGECSGCHDSHSAPHRKLLREEGSELCAGCHEELMELIEDAEHVHDPAEDDCTDCHDPHSGPHENQLFAEKRKLCDECHDDVVEAAEEARVDHSPVLSGEECITCHSPHASNEEKLLKEPRNELCLGCHDEKVESGEKTLADIKGLLEQHTVWHEPIAEKGCTACHRPHGSKRFRLLEKSFPSRFYASFDLESYSLCFSCHEAPLVTAKSTREATGFRDGDRNLHFLHVNREKKGRTCRACHEMHAGTEPLLVRDKVPFGKWMMPIRFEKSPNGGSCQPGCHEKAGYDREK